MDWKLQTVTLDDKEDYTQRVTENSKEDNLFIKIISFS